MAGAAAAAELLFLHPLREFFADEIQAFNSFPSNDIDDEIYGPDLFSPEFRLFPPSNQPLHDPILIRDPSDEEDTRTEAENPVHVSIHDIEDSDSNFFDAQDHVSLTVGLFDRSTQRTDAFDSSFTMNPFADTVRGSDFGFFDENDGLGGSNLLDLELGFGVGFDAQGDIDEAFGDGFVADLRDSVLQPCELSEVSDGLRIVGFGSDTESEERHNAGVDLDLNSDGGDASDSINDDLSNAP